MWVIHKQSLISGMVEADERVKRIFIHDTYTNEHLDVLVLHPQIRSDQEQYWYAKRSEKCRQLNRDHNKYLADIIEVCESIPT